MKPVATLLLSTALLTTGTTTSAADPTAEDIAIKVDYVNLSNAARNITYGTRDRPAVILDLAADGSMLVNTMERWRSNDYPEGSIAARDLVIFGSGKLRGTGILVTDYVDVDKGRSYAVWLPSLRKVRRFSEPDPADTWGNSNFSYGDIYIRRPEDERHELLGRELFEDCLGVIRLPNDRRIPQASSMPEADCSMKGKTVYRLRSRPHRTDLGYDERISWVDAETYADYRSVYYSKGEVLKTIDKSWHSMGLDDPLAQYWVYWYAHTESSGQQGMAFVDPGAVSWNDDLDPALWSEGALSRIRR